MRDNLRNEMRTLPGSHRSGKRPLFAFSLRYGVGGFTQRTIGVLKL
jgi:hypothetical protein